MHRIGNWTVIDDKNVCKIRIDNGDILDIIAVSFDTMLSINALFDDTVNVQDGDDRVCIFLYRRSKDDDVVPLSDGSQKDVQMGSFGDVKNGGAVIDANFHTKVTKSVRFELGMDECFVKIQDERFASAFKRFGSRDH